MIIVYFLLLLCGAHAQGLDGPCPKGHQLRANENKCDKCARGRYHEQKSHMDTGPCKACPAGYQDTYNVPFGDPQLATCEMCPSGYYQEHQGHWWCKECGKKYHTTTTCYDNECDAGEYLSGDTCTLCSPGKYSTGGRATSCTKCPPGKFGFGGLSGAPHCEDCPAGYTTKLLETVSVIQYVAGLPNDHLWFPTCSQCDEGKYSVGGSICCKPGQVQHVSMGTYSCWYCSAGKYEIGGKCTKCEAGKYSGSVGATSADTCTDCGAGKYSNNDASACIACEAGKYSGQLAATSKDTCTDCEAGRYSNSAAPACIDCEGESTPPLVPQPVYSLSTHVPAELSQITQLLALTARRENTVI